MTGQIPKYGANFLRERVDVWHSELNSTRYLLKADHAWYIRADKTSKRWWVFFGGVRTGNPFPTMQAAMEACVAAVKALTP